MFGTFVQKFSFVRSCKIRCEIFIGVIWQSEVKIEAEEVSAEGVAVIEGELSDVVEGVVVLFFTEVDGFFLGETELTDDLCV